MASPRAKDVAAIIEQDQAQVTVKGAVVREEEHKSKEKDAADASDVHLESPTTVGHETKTVVETHTVVEHAEVSVEGIDAIAAETGAVELDYSVAATRGSSEAGESVKTEDFAGGDSFPDEESS
jgi:hypothetical protein